MIFEFFVSIWSDPITTYVAGGSDPNGTIHWGLTVRPAKGI